jgi:hypothetical protein
MLLFSFSQIRSVKGCATKGWPDWANIRLMGDCLLWAIFLKNCRSSPHFGATFFYGKSYVIILTKKWVGLHFRWFFSRTHLVTLRRATGSNLGSFLWSASYPPKQQSTLCGEINVGKSATKPIFLSNNIFPNFPENNSHAFPPSSFLIPLELQSAQKLLISRIK